MSRRSFMLALTSLLVGSLVVGSTTPVTAAEPVRARQVEKYAMRLLNCTRTGGWVTASGRCRGRGSGTYSVLRKPLVRSWGISNKVAWPWARTLVTENECAHELAGRPTLSQRFASRGFGHWGIGENIGCSWGFKARQAVLRSHRAMQAERSSDGGHWRNMKDRRWKRVGVAVAKHDGMVVVVYDFYAEAVR